MYKPLSLHAASNSGLVSNFIESVVKRTLKESSSFGDFQLRLKDKNIDMILHENSSGIFGISYRSIDIENPFIIKSSALNKVSYSDILLSFESPLEISEAIEFTKPDNIREDSIISNTLSGLTGKSMKKGDEDEDDIKKKKKKKGRNL